MAGRVGVAIVVGMAPVAASGDLAALPKAHLHLHLTGAMRRKTLRELAA